MSTIPVKDIERNRSKTAGQNHVFVRSANDFRGGGEVYCFALGSGT
jgi:hypothetical protein